MPRLAATPLLFSERGPGARCWAWRTAACLLAGLWFASARAEPLPLESPFPDAALIEGKQRAAAVGETAKRLPAPDPRQGLVDVLHYTNQLVIEPANGMLTGMTWVTFLPYAANVSELVLDFLNGPLLVVGVFAQGGGPLPFTHANDLLLIQLPPSAGPVVPRSVGIVFSGHPQPHGFMGFGFTELPDGTPVAATLSEPWSARSWWPCKDDPRDKATTAAILVVPEGLTAVSNGRQLYPAGAARSVPRSSGAGPRGVTELAAAAAHWDEATRVRLAPALAPGPWTEILETTDPNRRMSTFTWFEGRPIATYHFSVAVSAYTELDDFFADGADTVAIRHFVYPDLAAAAAFDFENLPAMMAFCSERFGPYPFDGEKYGMALFEWDGAMEHPTATSYGSRFVTGDRAYESIVMHELAHQWFGNLVTCSDWTHTWLNEGFATYVEALWAEYAYGFWYRWWFMHSRSNFGTWTDPLVRARDNPDPWYYFAPMVYHKGAWVLHMLRRWLGDDMFFNCLQTYLRDPRLRYGAATSDDFIHVCRQTSGQDLDWFFDQWLYRTVHPQLRIDWDNIPDAGATGVALHVAIDQVQPPDPIYGDAPFRIPIELRLLGPGYDARTTLLMESRHQEFVVPVPVGLTRVVVDPDRWLLHRVMRLTAAGEPPVPARLLPPAPNPFNPRTVLSWETGTPSSDVLTLRDARGRTVLSRQWPLQPSGRRQFTWDGADDRGHRCASGVYLVDVSCTFAEPTGPQPPERLQGKITLAR